LFRKSLFVVVVLATLLHAQNPRGSLRGAVQDATGARIPSASIVVQSVDSRMQRTATSEDRGEFRLDDLLPGAYRMTVTAVGFAPAQANVTIAVSSVREVTVTLKLAAPAETVSVEGQNSSITTQPVDLVSVVHQGIVSSQDLQTLPLAARSFANTKYERPAMLALLGEAADKTVLDAGCAGGEYAAHLLEAPHETFTTVFKVLPPAQTPPGGGLIRRTHPALGQDDLSGCDVAKVEPPHGTMGDQHSRKCRHQRA